MNKESFLSRVEIVTESGCWIWMGATRNGYGKMHVKGSGKWQKVLLAHRVSYEMFKGSIPSDKCVCHTCDVPLCVNPNHLWIGTSAENTGDSVKKNRRAKGGLNGAVIHRDRFQGEHNPAAVLTAQDVLDIRSSSLSRPELAREYGVTYCSIRNVLDRVTWQHI